MDKNFIQEMAWIGNDYVKGNVKGAILSFHGLGGGLKTAPGTEELEWAPGATVSQHFRYSSSRVPRPSGRAKDTLPKGNATQQR